MKKVKKVIRFTVDAKGQSGDIVVEIPGYDRGVTYDVSITAISSSGVTNKIGVDREQMNDLIFILGQVKKEYGLPD